MAEVFADVDDEGVKFIEELVVGGKGRFKHFADVIVG